MGKIDLLKNLSNQTTTMLPELAENFELVTKEACVTWAHNNAIYTDNIALIFLLATLIVLVARDYIKSDFKGLDYYFVLAGIICLFIVKWLF